MTFAYILAIYNDRKLKIVESRMCYKKKKEFFYCRAKSPFLLFVLWFKMHNLFKYAVQADKTIAAVKAFECDDIRNAVANYS